jgi:hypothetical protein
VCKGRVGESETRFLYESWGSMTSKWYYSSKKRNVWSTRLFETAKWRSYKIPWIIKSEIVRKSNETLRVRFE